MRASLSLFGGLRNIDGWMVERRSVRVALIALLAMLVVGAYAAPSASAAGFRATKCCAERCAKPRTADAARHCCPSVVAANDVGAFAVSAKGGVHAATATTAIVAPIPSIQSTSESPAPTAASPRAAPLFLRTLSLRL